MLAIDADSHFVEPWIFSSGASTPAFAIVPTRWKRTGHRQAAAVVDNKPLRLLDAEELLSAISGYGQKESGHDSATLIATCPQRRVAGYGPTREILDREGFAAQVTYPTVGPLEAAVQDPALADALAALTTRGRWKSVLPTRTD